MSTITGTFDNVNVGRTVLNSSSVLNVNGNVSVKAGSFIKFGTDTNPTYGIRDYGGLLYFCNSQGTWQSLNVIQNGYISFTDVNNNLPYYPTDIQNPYDPSTGCGIRLYNGTLQFKNSIGANSTSWINFGTGTGSGSGSGSTSGVLYSNNTNPNVWIGGQEYNITLTNNLQDFGMMHCDVYELVPSTATSTSNPTPSVNNIDTTWNINYDDQLFVQYNYRNTRTGTVTPSITYGTNVQLTMNGSTWTTNDVNMEFRGNGGRVIITDLVSSTLANGIFNQESASYFNSSTGETITPTWQFANTNPISTWYLYAGIFESDNSYKIVSSGMQNYYKMSTNMFVGIYNQKYFMNLTHIGKSYTSNGISETTISGGYVNTPVNFFTTPNGSNSINWRINDNITYNRASLTLENYSSFTNGGGAGQMSAYRINGCKVAMFNPQICVNKSINMTAVYCLKLECGSGGYSNVFSNGGTNYSYNGQKYIGYSGNSNGLQGACISTDLLFFMKDGEIMDWVPKNGDNYCGHVPYNTATNTNQLLPLLYLPSIVSVGGYYILASNMLGAMYGYETDGVLLINVYNNLGNLVFNNNTVFSTNSRSYYIAKSAQTSQSNNFTCLLLNAKLYLGGQNTIWVIGIGCNTTCNGSYNLQSMPSCVPLFYYINRLSISSNGVLSRISTYTEQLNSPLTGNNGTGTGSVYFRKVFNVTFVGYYNNYSAGLIVKPGSCFNREGSTYNNTVNQNNYSYCTFLGGSLGYDGNQDLSNNMTNIPVESTDFRHYYPDAYVVPVINDTYIIFSQTNTTWVPSSYSGNIFYLYYTLFSNSTYTVNSGVNNSGAGFTNIKIPLISSTSTTDFVGFNQLLPIGIYIPSMQGILIVWNGRSSSKGIGTYYMFMTNLSSTLSFSTTTLLTSNVPGEGSYYNLIIKSNNTVVLMFNAGQNQIYEYILSNGSTVFYLRTQPSSNLKYQTLMTLIGDGTDGYNNHSTLSIDNYNDKIIGVGMFTMASMANYLGQNILNQIKNSGNTTQYYFNNNSDFSSAQARLNNFYTLTHPGLYNYSTDGVISGDNLCYNSNIVNCQSNYQMTSTNPSIATKQLPSHPYMFTEKTTSYEWNIYNRILTNFTTFQNLNHINPVIQIYNNIYYIVWQGYNSSISTVSKIYFSTSLNSGQTWTTPIRVSDIGVTYNERSPHMIIDSSGIIHIVFASQSSYDGTNYQIFYVRSTDSISFSTTGTIGGISQLIGYSQDYPIIQNCIPGSGSIQLFVVWQGKSSTYGSSTKIFYAYNTDNGINGSSSLWTFNGAVGLTPTTSIWGNTYNQILPCIAYNSSNGFMYITWIGKSSENTTLNRIFVAFSNNNGQTFVHNYSGTNTGANYLGINSGYGGVYYNSIAYDFIAQHSSIDKNGNLHVLYMYAASQNLPIVANTYITDVFTSFIQYNNSTSSWGSWSTPKILSNNTFSVGLNNNGYRELQVLVDTTGKVNYLFKTRCQYINIDNNVNVANNKSFLSHATYQNGQYSDTLPLLNSIYNLGVSDYTYYTRIRTITGNTSTNPMDYGLYCTVNISNNNLILISFSDQRLRFYNATNATETTSLYLYEYTNDNVQFGFTNMAPIKTLGTSSALGDTTNTQYGENNVFSLLVTLSNNNNVFFVTFSSKINNTYYVCYAYTSNNGVSWTTGVIGTGFGNNGSFTLLNLGQQPLSIFQDPISLENVYILFQNSSSSVGYYKSTNYGQTFTICSTILTPIASTINVASMTVYNRIVYVVYTRTDGLTFIANILTDAGAWTQSQIQNTIAPLNINYKYLIKPKILFYNYVNNGITYPQLHIMFYGASNQVNAIQTQNQHLYYVNVSVNITTGALTYSTNSLELVALPFILQQIGSADMDINSYTNTVYIVYSNKPFDTINNTYLVMTNRTIGDISTNGTTLWNNATNYNISTEGTSGVSYYLMTEGLPNITITNNRIYMISFGTHWNNIAFSANPYYKYSTKDLSNPNSRFINNLYPINMDQFFNLQKQSNIDYYRTATLNQLVSLSNINSFNTYNPQINCFYSYTITSSVTSSMCDSIFSTFSSSIKIDKYSIINIAANCFNCFYDYNLSGAYGNGQTANSSDYQKQTQFFDPTSTSQLLIYPRVYYFRSINQNICNKNTLVSTVSSTSTGNINTQFWNSLTQCVLQESTNGQTAWYAICYVSSLYHTWYVFSGSTYRVIATLNLTTLQYQINTGSVSFATTNMVNYTPTSGSSQDELTIKVLEYAIGLPSTISYNQMSGLQLNNATTYPPITNVLSLRFAILLSTNTPTTIPQTYNCTMNYNGQFYYQRQTNNYIVKIKNLSTVSLTPPNDGKKRTAIVYITDGTTSGSNTPQSNFTQISTNQSITQPLTTSFTFLNTNNGSYLTNQISNTMFGINNQNNGFISINALGTYNIQCTFDTSFNNLTSLTDNISYGFDGMNILQRKTVNNTNVYDCVILRQLVTVTNVPYTFSLYMLCENSQNSNNLTTTVENLNFFITKLS